MQLVYNFDENTIPIGVYVLFWLLYLLVFVRAFIELVFLQDSSARKFNIPTKRVPDVSKWFILFFALFVVFYCVNPDYFRYREWMYRFDPSLWEKEKFYAYLVLFCRSLPLGYSFELFRLIVWGGAILIAYYTFRQYRGILLPGLALLFLFIFYAGTFSYARASLAMAVYFFGVSLLLQSRSGLWKYVGIGIALSSVVFHREMLVAVAVLPALLIPFEKKKILILSVILIIVGGIVLMLAGSVFDLMESIFDSDDMSAKIDQLNEKEQRTFRLSTFISYLCYFYPLFLITQQFWKEKVPMCIAKIYRITFAIVMVSVMFMIVDGPRSVYTYRILFIAMIPMALMMSHFYYHGSIKRKQLLVLFVLALLSNSTRFINSF